MTATRDLVPVQASTAPPSAPRGAATAAGVLAGGCGLLAGEVLGRVVPGGASPVLSVGDRVVDLFPDGARRAAISTFGTADKPLLLAGVLLVCGLLAALGGLLAQRSRTGAAALVALLAVVAAAAQAGEAGTGPAGIAATCLGLFVVTLGVLSWLVPAQGVAPPQGRRAFVVRAFWAAGGLAAGGGVLRYLMSRDRVDALRAAVGIPAPVRTAPGDLVAADLGVPGLSPVLTPNADFFRIDTALMVPQVDPTTWTLTIDGMVDAPYALTYADLLAMPQVEADITIQCVSFEIGGDLVGTARWQGVLLRDVLARAGVQAGAEQVMGESVDGFTAGFPLSFATDARFTMVALAMNGEPLPVEHGFPARLVVPGLYGYVSATKWLSRISLVPRSAQGYWVPRGWSQDGPIKTMSRIEVPRDRTLVEAGRAVVAGTAWAPGRGRGVTEVEVRVDEGPWRRADLGGALSEDTWRQWRWEWDAEPGDHLIEVRATDRLGAVQTGETAPPAPDGATGYHGVLVRVTA